MTDPIIIVSLPRSGSSMVAGAFAQHGVWTGTCKPGDARNARGYFESVRIADLIGQRCGHLVHKGVPAPHVPGWRGAVERVIREDGYVGGPWLWKGSAMYAPLWHEYEPTWIVVRRDLDAIRRSGKASGRYRANPHSIREHLAIMDQLEDDGAVAVDSEAVVSGDFSTLGDALRSAGISPDLDTLTRWIDPTLWRHG